MKKRLCALIVVALLFAVAVGDVFAQERLPGVVAGNEFTYSQTSYWLTTSPNVSPPSGLRDVNMTAYYKVTVTGVSGTNVSTRTLWQFANGTEVQEDGSVSTETTAYQGGYWVIIASNLNENDRVHPGSEQDLSTINGTLALNPWNTPENRDYQRQTNFLILDFSYEQSDIPNSTYTEHVSTYFDRQTGALVHLEDVHTYHNPEIMLTVVWNLVSQNAWTSVVTGQSPLFIAAIAAIIVIIVILLYAELKYWRKRLKKTPTAKKSGRKSRSDNLDQLE
jgi:hypothetical protein